MLILWLICVFMSIVAAGFVVFPLWVDHSDDEISRNEMNSQAFQGRLDEINNDLDACRITKNEFEQLKTELEMAFLKDIPLTDKSKGSLPGSRNRVVLILVLVCVPVLSLTIYGLEGSNGKVADWLTLQDEMAPVLDDLLAGKTPDSSANTFTVNQVVAVLQARAQKNPDDHQIWHSLGVGYLQLQSFTSAEQAFRQAYRLQPDNLEYAMALVQALAGSSQGALTQQSEKLLRKVLTAAPQHSQALALYGMGMFIAERYEDAIVMWKKLLATKGSRAHNAEVVLKSIEVAESRLAKTTEDAALSTGKTANVSVTANVVVSLDETLAEGLEPGSMILVYAQALKGPKQPLAIIRRPVTSFPLAVELSDQQSMIPGMLLSKFNSVKFKARISKRGGATLVTGDLVGETDVIDLASIEGDIKVIINQRVE